ncbi:MAG: carbohydrate ABC transporter permease, partial [Desulfobacteraceae bacterium]|nr:carbohydrate ABC transporter permease [Desulfobacteraceae bacterium]
WMLVALHVTFQLPLVIFLYTGFIKSIPRALDEAAMIDGCSRFGIFFRIIMPLLKPVTATAMILVGLAIWNDYQFSLFFLQRPSTQTFPVVLAQFFSQHQNNVSWVAAGSLLSMIPMTVMYIFLQKYFISGLAEGAVKG